MSRPLPAAVILARGLGTRMRRADPGVALDDDQSRLADLGAKALIPVGRPLLDYTLSDLADLGLEEALLVIGPEHQTLFASRYGDRPTRLRVRTVIQPSPLGTADAVASASPELRGRDALVLNGDNYYPTEAIRWLVGQSGPAVVAFGYDALRDGGIPAERLSRYPILSWDRSFRLTAIDQSRPARPGDHLSMNCWRLPPGVVEACDRIAPAPSGERELPRAVAEALAEGLVMKVQPLDLPVLDLSTRTDIPGVTSRLAGREVRL